MLRDPEVRREYDIKADVERTLEQKAEEMERHWMVRRTVRGKVERMWEEEA